MLGAVEGWYGGLLEEAALLHQKATSISLTALVPPCRSHGLLKQIVTFLHENRREGCTTGAVDNAASGGHLGLLKFLCLNRAEGGTVYAMVLAAWHGHLEVVKWFHENREEVRVSIRIGQGRQQHRRDTSLHGEQ